MPFANQILGGQNKLIRPAIQSPDYSPGVSGWQIRKDGSVEFNGGIFRGVLSASVFEGTDFIVSENGEFFYFGSPAADDLAVTVAPAVGTDIYGNAFLEGLCAYEGYIAATLHGTGLTIYYNSSSGQSGTWNPVGSLYVIEVSSIVYWYSSVGMIVAEPVSAQLPGTGPPSVQPETWHGITLDSGWTAGAQAPEYRLLPDGNVQVRGQCSHASVTAVTAINSGTPVPGVYRPAIARYYRGADPGDSAGLVQIDNGGVFSVRGSAGYSVNQALMDGIYSI